MKPHLKKLQNQVMVITGASSGIGLATARQAARRGAKLVLACRNEDALNKLVDEMRGAGHDAIAVRADVGNYADHEAILAAALERYGRVDTWVNNAGVSIFGRLTEVAIEDQRKLFDTNYWGVVYGSMVAVAHLKKNGGALINVGSEVSDRAVPLQGAYSASKHAVKGFTDALRMELQDEGAPVSVTLIKPAAVNTGFVRHAKNYLDVEPQLPPPIYAPEVVADAILFAAENPERDIYVGGASKMNSVGGQRMPGLMDKMGRMLIRQQRSHVPATQRADALYQAGEDLTPTENTTRSVHHHSAYTHLTTRGRGWVWAGAGLALGYAVLAAIPKLRSDMAAMPQLRHGAGRY